MNTRRLATLTAAGGLLAFVLWHRPPPTRLAIPVPSRAEPTSAPLPQAVSPPSVSPERPNSTPTQPALTETAPSLRELRADVARDPHAPPASLMQFTVALHAKERDALASANSAQAFFPELRDCVLNHRAESSSQVRALCLLNAKRLQKAYPILAGSYGQLEREADPKDVALVQGFRL